jgi:hypothetical protein
MLFTPIILLAAAATASAATGASPICQDTHPRKVSKSAGRARQAAKPDKLVDLPPANQILAVLRRENGCAKPVVVRENVGAVPIGNN